MAKIYLSAAAHINDNHTKCPGNCGENVHCNAYMDIVEKRLKTLGFEVKRTHKTKVGDAALKSRVKDANDWGADLYYVAHTNAGGGRYSMTMHYPGEANEKKASVFTKYRKSVKSHKVVSRSNLYEIKATKMPCLYDELFFHDNAEDCKWFHESGMFTMAEETVQALCEICGVKYTEPQPAKREPQPGDIFAMNGDKLFYSSTGKAYVKRTGTFYYYDGVKVNGRYRVTNKASRVGKKPVVVNVSGWVEE